ncbi:hypothetical protein RI129_001548 [Pyrocoelia pectoralis]|uniref:Uncharacterized protein n=1 Tax=Pyrocoelia pectoralis TaxID=417401 RepID=A0AAN7VVS7_9COLE
MSNENIQENCRLCQQMPGTIDVIQNREFIDKVFDVTKVKINHDQMELFPKAVCTTCELSIEQMYCFVQQIRLVNKKLHSIISLPTPVNSKVYNTRNKQNSTSKLKGNDNFNLKCPVCATICFTITSLDIHKQSHTGDLQCMKQDLDKNVTESKHSVSMASREDHINVSTGSTLKVEDSSDKEENPKINSLNNTEEKTKKTKSVFPCTFENCTKVCTSSYTLRTHIMKHEGKTPFLCVTCGKGFRTKNSLNCHEKIHAEIKPYVCDECNIRFSVSSNLRAHQKKHHEGVRYYCSQCPLVYISKYSLERHELVHTGVKKFKCGACKAAFYTNKELLKHGRYHQGLRLYKCEQCFKTFFEKHHLTVHIRGHTGERPYVCKMVGCDKSFTESQKLTRHLKARHPLL